MGMEKLTISAAKLEDLDNASLNGEIMTLSEYEPSSTESLSMVAQCTAATRPITRCILHPFLGRRRNSKVLLFCGETFPTGIHNGCFLFKGLIILNFEESSPKQKLDYKRFFKIKTSIVNTLPGFSPIFCLQKSFLQANREMLDVGGKAAQSSGIVTVRDPERERRRAARNKEKRATLILGEVEKLPCLPIQIMLFCGITTQSEE